MPIATLLTVLDLNLSNSPKSSAKQQNNIFTSNISHIKCPKFSKQANHQVSVLASYWFKDFPKIPNILLIAVQFYFFMAWLAFIDWHNSFPVLFLGTLIVLPYSFNWILLREFKLKGRQEI